MEIPQKRIPTRGHHDATTMMSPETPFGSATSGAGGKEVFSIVTTISSIGKIGRGGADSNAVHGFRETPAFLKASRAQFDEGTYRRAGRSNTSRFVVVVCRTGIAFQSHPFTIFFIWLWHCSFLNFPLSALRMMEDSEKQAYMEALRHDKDFVLRESEPTKFLRCVDFNPVRCA